MEKVKINDGWRFWKEREGEGSARSVCLPHTWNAQDGSDGGSDYDRTKTFYERKLYISGKYAGKRLYLEFGAAGTAAELFVNGVPVPYAKYDIYEIGNGMEYKHRGGFSRFRFDVTDHVKTGETNSVRVAVDNTRTIEIAPLNGDFNMQGGLYRDVYLVAVSEVHIDLSDYGSDGIYLTPRKATPVTDTENGDFLLELAARIVNDGRTVKKLCVKAALCEPSYYEVPDNDYIREHLRFRPEDMYREGGRCAAEFEDYEAEIAPGEKCTVHRMLAVKSPRLWNGLADPYRYVVHVSVFADGEPVEEAKKYVGFRYFEIPNPVRGEDGKLSGGKFYLNGREYVLRGACKHQDIGRGEGARGYAVTEDDRLADAGIMYELGMNAVRLVHYQHAEEELELYDKLGILVWSELGLVGEIISAGAKAYQTFLNVTKCQLRELIKQQYNHPCVCVWGLSNVVRVETDDRLMHMEETDMSVPSASAFFGELDRTVKEIDSIRPTTYAIFSRFHRKEDWPSDIYALNHYPYWYTSLAWEMHGGNESMTGQVTYNSGLLNGKGLEKPVGVSEYGASAVIGYTMPFREDGTVENPGVMSYTTTYQAYVHEKVYREIVEELPFLWCSFVWQLFDSASDKKESLLAGINDKGLVQYDHRTKKDAFYFYKANWNRFEPFIHVVSSDSADIVRAYSNCDALQLYVNGLPIGERISDVCVWDGVTDGMGIFRWYRVPAGRIRIVGYRNGVQAAEVM